MWQYPDSFPANVFSGKILSNHLCSLFSGIIFDPSHLGACKMNVANVILRYFVESAGFFICSLFTSKIKLFNKVTIGIYNPNPNP